MPVYLKDINAFPELESFKSVLIVPCRFCPAASVAVRRNHPYSRGAGMYVIGSTGVERRTYPLKSNN